MINYDDNSNSLRGKIISFLVKIKRRLNINISHLVGMRYLLFLSLVLPLCCGQSVWPPMPSFRCLDAYNLAANDRTVSMMKESPYTFLEDSGYEPVDSPLMGDDRQFQCEYDPFTFCDNRDEEFYQMPCNKLLIILHPIFIIVEIFQKNFRQLSCIREMCHWSS